MKHSIVCQRYIKRPVRDIVSYFSEPLPDGAYPLVLVPKKRGTFFGFTIVPSKSKCLVQHGGRAMPLKKSGLRFVLSPLWRVAYIVAEQDVQYDCPVERAATKDDVMVNLDFMVSFRIENADLFVYKIGAAKFDLLLRGAVQEAIRHLARQYTHQAILDLHGTSCGDFLEELSAQFKPYGVVFNTAKITEVTLPKGISDDLSRFTTISKDIETCKREFEHALMKLENEQTLTTTGITLECERQCTEQRSKKIAAETLSKEAIIKAEEDRSVAVTKAEEGAATKIRGATAALIAAKLEEERMCQELIGRAKANLAAAEAEFDRLVIAAKTKAAAIREAANDEARAVSALGAAEKKFGSQLNAVRMQAVNLSRIAATTHLAATGEMTIAGPAAENILAEIMTNAAAHPIAAGASASAR